jgi:hypothetical protein
LFVGGDRSGQARHTGAGNTVIDTDRLTSHSVFPGLRLFSLRPSEAGASLDGLIGPIPKLI